MRKDTRKEIMDQARALFNANGFDGVSVQDIADRVNISKGNLTYHFAKKEDIVEALLNEDPFEVPEEYATTLEELDNAFMSIREAAEKHIFLYSCPERIAEVSWFAAARQKNDYESAREYLLNSFKALNDNGMLKDETFDGEYARVVDTLCTLCIFSVSFETVQKRVGCDMDIRLLVWGVLYSFLTPAGQVECGIPA